MPSTPTYNFKNTTQKTNESDNPHGQPKNTEDNKKRMAWTESPSEHEGGR